MIFTFEQRYPSFQLASSRTSCWSRGEGGMLCTALMPPQEDESSRLGKIRLAYSVMVS